MARVKTAKAAEPVDDEFLDELEASWPKTKELAFAIDDPMEKLMEKAHAIFAGKYWENLDSLALRIADVCPRGITEDNFLAAEPVAKACIAYYGNVEKLRLGLKRPFLDAGKAVDEAAKATVTRAEKTLDPIIEAFKKIRDRKKAEAAKAEADRLKKIEDDRLAAEKAHRDLIEAEHAAEKKRLADEAERLRLQTEQLQKQQREAEAKSKAANDELAELRKQIEQMGRAPEVKVSPELAKAIVEAPDEKIVVVDIPKVGVVASYRPAWKPSAPPAFDELPPVKQQDWEKARDQACDLPAPADADQQKVRDFGMAIKMFLDTLTRPTLVKSEARQAVELAVFDVYGIANSLQEWSVP